MAEKHVWRVTEWDRWKRVVQRRNIPAYSRAEAKAKYDGRYREYPRTKLTAVIIGEMSEWAGDPEE